MYRKLKPLENNFTVYLKKDTPPRWHYGKKDDTFNHIGDIVITSHMPFVFESRYNNPGAHGFDNALQEMQASFYAWGPAFRQNFKIANFENVHVYPLIAHLLGLQYEATSIDGRFEVLEPILKNP